MNGAARNIISGNGFEFEIGAPPVERSEPIVREAAIAILVDCGMENTNVWCFRRNGKKIWEIEGSIDGYPYCGVIDSGVDGAFFAFTQSGSKYCVDFDTGHINLVGASK